MANQSLEPSDPSGRLDAQKITNESEVPPPGSDGSEVPETELPRVEMHIQSEESVRTRRSSAESSQSLSSSVNLNTDLGHAALIAHPISQYHEKSMENVMVCLLVTSAAIAILGYMNLNIGWCAGVVCIATISIRRRNDGIKDDFLAHMSRKRLEALQHPESPGESAEWINSIVKTIWPILNPDLFSSLMELLEDTLKKESPSIISSVRVEDLVLGPNSMRILSVKVLPNTVEIGGTTRPEEGDFISLELEFSYRRLPPPSHKGSNIHFMAYFGMGPKIASFEVPVIVEIRGAIGRLRLRVQLISDPPFVRHAYICFPQIPELIVVANPLRSAIDLMNLPILSQFVQKSIRDVLKSFTSPSWYSVDCSRLLVGSDVEVSPQSTGIICVTIHFASGISGPDNGYVSVGLARFGKPIHSTRTIENHKGEPHFEEVFFIRVIPDDMDNGDQLRLTVWDSDEHHGDDIFGRIDMYLGDIFQSPNNLTHHQLPLTQIARRSQPNGTLAFSVGFFTMAARDLNKAINASTSKIIPPYLLHRPDEVNSRAGLYSERIKGALEALTPPDIDLPSGVLSLQIHQLENLEIPNVHGALGSHQRTKSSRQRSQAPPSTYCQLFLNDEKITQTRVKKFSSNPYINSSSEIFCRDWATAHIRLVVLESREKDHDVVIGAVAATLRYMLHGRTQKTMWHSLVGGIGSGRLRMSVLFKSVVISIPRSIRSWNLGVVLVGRMTAIGVPASFSGDVEVIIGPSISRTPNRSIANSADHNNADTAASTAFSWSLDPPIRLPVLQRYQSAIIFRITFNEEVFGEAVLWLSTIGDDEIATIRLPIYNRELPRLRSNNFTNLPILSKNGTARDKVKNNFTFDGDVWDIPQSIAVLEVDVRFQPGISESHCGLHEQRPTELDDAIRAWNLDVRGEEKYGSKLGFSPGISRTPTASQPNSRRSSLGDAYMSDGAENNKNPKRSMDRPVLPSRSSKEDSGKTKIPKTVKWVKDSKKRLSKIGRSSKDNATKPTKRDNTEHAMSSVLSESGQGDSGQRESS